MTGTEILNTIHTLYENDLDYPSSTDEDYLVRLSYVNQSIRKWESEIFNGFLWTELFKTVINPLTTTSIPDFLHPEKMYIGAQEYTYVLPHKAIEIIANWGGDHIYYITGGYGNKIINVYPGVTGTGYYNLSYYKVASIFTSENIGEHAEMMDPNYIIYNVLSQLYANDGDASLAELSINNMNKAMERMKNGFNTMPYSSFQTMDDNNSGFGL